MAVTTKTSITSNCGESARIKKTTNGPPKFVFSHTSISFYKIQIIQNTSERFLIIIHLRTLIGCTKSMPSFLNKHETKPFIQTQVFIHYTFVTFKTPFHPNPNNLHFLITKACSKYSHHFHVPLFSISFLLLFLLGCPSISIFLL
jgi:hypothetical protein